MGSDEDKDKVQTKSSPEAHTQPKRAITSYKMCPPLKDKFKGIQIKGIIQKVLKDKLQGKVYNMDEVSSWTRDVADTINVAIKEQVHMPRYKYIVQVMLGQQLGSGCHYFAKCYWDVETDSYISDVFHNPTLFCVCTVYGWRAFVSLILTLPSLAIVLYMCWFQAYILKLEILLSALMIALQCAQIISACIFICTMCRPVEYT